jgi:GNAT superfamily N-acetyltransferase
LSSWNAATILDALKQIDASAMSDDVERMVTAEYELVRFPQHFLSPTFPAAQVLWSDVARPFGAAFDEVTRTVRGWNLDALHWWVTSATRPTDTESELLARSGERSDTFQILARELAENADSPRVDEGITVELVRDDRTLRNAVVVETLGWGRATPSEETFDRRFLDTLRDLEDWAAFQVVASVNGDPAATGCCTIVGDVARLWGAVTLPAFRRHGCYQAVLSTRTRLAVERGATLALTRGRPLTSGPLLIRAGFTVYGEERCYRLAIN